MKFNKIGRAFGTDMYTASAGLFSFVIGHNELGYSASYKDRYYNGKQSSHYIDGSPFTTYIEAEKACKNEWKRLRGY